jgi:hypothetical protein
MKTPIAVHPKLDWKFTAAGVAGLTLVVWLACFLFPSVWVTTGIGEANRPFMDLYGILAASDAAQAGVDPFQPNSFDPYHRPHVYSEWWLELRRLGLTRADTLWLGFTLVATALLVMLVMVRPRTRAQGFGLLLLLISPAFLITVNRANSDLVVFVLIGLGLLCFRREQWELRALGLLLFAVSAVLKYYPLITLVLLLEVRSRRGFAAGLSLYIMVLVLAWPGLEPGMKSAALFIPRPEWLYAYGAPVIMRNFGLIGAQGLLFPAGLLVVWAAASAWMNIEGFRANTPASEQAAEREFLIGAAMLTGLFLSGSSYVYKLVFAVWLLPWLWQRHDDPTERRWCHVTWSLLLAIVWCEGAAALGLNLVFGTQSLPLAMGLLKVALTVSQLLTWAWVACLLRLLLIMFGRRVRVWWVTDPIHS